MTSRNTQTHGTPKAPVTYTIHSIIANYLLEPDNIWMPQGSVVDDFPLNILINLKTRKPKQNSYPE